MPQTQSQLQISSGVSILPTDITRADLPRRTPLGPIQLENDNSTYRLRKCLRRHAYHNPRDCDHRHSHPATPENTFDALSSVITIATAPAANNANSIPTCPHCARAFASRIGLIGHMQIHCTEAGEPVPREPTYARCNCP
nr:unnamed protein product [Spirometra erinaceieuropaei]